MNIKNYNKIVRLILDIAESQKHLKEIVDEDIKTREEIKEFKKKLNNFSKEDIKIVVNDIFF
jgi:hypothetical protein